MDTKKLGRQTMILSHPPVLTGWGSAAGRKEGKGPLGPTFDFTAADDALGSKTW